jgi:hypothetical protein
MKRKIDVHLVHTTTNLFSTSLLSQSPETSEAYLSAKLLALSRLSVTISLLARANLT